MKNGKLDRPDEGEREQVDYQGHWSHPDITDILRVQVATVKEKRVVVVTEIYLTRVV